MNIIDKKHDQWLERLLESSHIGILIVDKARNNLFVNECLCQMFEYSEEELLSSTAEIFHVNNETFLKFAELAFNLVLNGSFVGIDYEFKKKDGTFFWAHIAGDVVEGQEEVLWTMVNITQRKIAENKVTLLKERMEQALLGSQGGIWDWGIVNNSIYFSLRWKEMLGYSDAEVENNFNSFDEFLHPDDYEFVYDTINKSLEGVEYFDMSFRLKHKAGHWIWVQSRGKTIYDADLKPIRMVGTHTDISVEKALQLQNAQQAQIIEQIHDSVISTDLNGHIVSWNLGSELLFGYTKDEILGKHVSILHLKKDIPKFKKSIDILREKGEYKGDVYLIKKSLEVVYVSLSLSLLKDEQGNPINMVAYAQDITLRKEAEVQLEKQKDILQHQAHHDALTGLPNRFLFSDRLEQSIEKAKRHNSVVALFFIDLDHFKEINDSLGHEVGDKVLQEATLRLQTSIRDEDTLARLGGDEFTVLLEDLKQGQNASNIAKKILENLEKPIYIDEHELYISSSIGISLYPDDGVTAQDLLKFADSAMYKAKDEGRNNYQFYSSEMTELAFERVVMETGIRSAIQNEEFVVYYQVQIDGRDNTLVGMEALVRWNHPIMGIVPPSKFIPLAESTGLIIDIDNFVMKTAMKQIATWYKEGLNPGVLAMNLAVKQLERKGFIEDFKVMMQDSECKAKWIELEVTEDQIMKNPEKAIKILDKISDMGIELAVDDFGTGYSSLSYLKKLPITKLKIDQSFVRDLPDDEEDTAITKAVIALAKGLNLNIIAEGVETKEQRDFLVKNGCANIQGYYYSKPIVASELKKRFL